MAVTQVKICNLALIRVGADRISSITESTKGAILLNAIYEQCRDEVQRDGRWNFNTKRDTLTPTSTEPAWGYDYEYDLPNDWLKFHEVSSGDIDFVIEDAKIRTDEEELDVLYAYRNEDESSWDSMFASALGWKLAMEIAYAMTQSVTLKQECEKSYKASLKDAKAVDGQEGVLKDPEIVAWTDARR